MKKTYLTLSTGQIVCVQWDYSHKYNSERYKEWLSSLKDGFPTEKTKEYENLVCTRMFSVDKITICNVDAINLSQILVSLTIPGYVFRDLQKHIEENSAPIELTSKEVFNWLWENEIYN